MKYLFYIGHPAHYHNFKFVSQNLADNGHEIIWVVREKDVLFSLLEDVQFKTYYIKEKAPRSKLGRVRRILKRELRMLWIMLKHRPQLAIGTDLVITHIGKLLRISSVIVNEDDAEAVPLFANMGMKYATNILAPKCCSVGSYKHKTISYKGYQELAYLHPNYFSPDRSKIESLFNGRDCYFLLRFASLTAHHDNGVEGITDDLAVKIISILEKRGSVWITSERKLSPEFEKYRIAIPAKEMHHALFYTNLYVGDSQTMAAEAAVLGTPAIRFNDFVGKLSYLEELEHNYGLTFGIKTNQTDKLLELIEILSTKSDLREEWQKRRVKMLNEAIDVTDFWTKYFESYFLS